jgi:DNA mismatch repair ATPase MutL
MPNDAIGHELWREGNRFVVKDIPFASNHGTIVYINDIFHAIPAREKFLKSDSTER